MSKFIRSIFLLRHILLAVYSSAVKVKAKAMDGTFTMPIGQAKGVGDEPPMFLQRPSSLKSQDVTHILARTFRELYTKDVVASDTIQYLNASRGGEDEFHESYVIALQKVS